MITASVMKGLIEANVKKHESVLMSSLTGHLGMPMEFWQHRKIWEVDFASKLQEKGGFIVSWK